MRSTAIILVMILTALAGVMPLVAAVFIGFAVIGLGCFLILRRRRSLCASEVK